MAYDFKKDLADAEKRASKHRIPKQRHLFLRACSFVSVLLGKSGNVPDADLVHRLATGLYRAGNFYREVCVEQALRSRRGRPQHMADIGFIFAMASAYEGTWGRPKFRKYQNARIKKGEKGGTEQPTTFQQICNIWMEIVDPDRPPLTAAAFKDASKRYNRLSHRQ
jgi:hypothetical protein